MNSASRRLDELRALEWDRVVSRGSSATKSVQAVTVAQFRRHAVVLGIAAAAVAGIGAFVYFRGRKERLERKRLEPTLEKMCERAAAEQRPRRSLSGVLKKALGTWMFHSVVRPLLSKQS